MKHIKLFEEFIEEGFNDPNILKAFFMAGGPGSGKSFVATELFGFPKDVVSSVSYHTGLKIVNSDIAFEKLAKDGGYDISKLGEIKKDQKEWEKIMAIRNKAKSITKKQENNYLEGRLGLIIDGTGKDYDKLKKEKDLLDILGYDTYMVFVNTSLDVAQERNQNRARKVPKEFIKDALINVQNNIGKFQNLFGNKNLFIVDNSSYDNKDALNKVEKHLAKQLKVPIQNQIGKKWLYENDPKNKK